MYNPNIVRVGADDSVVAPTVRERLLQRLVAAFRDMPQTEWQKRCAEGVHRLQRVKQEVHALQLSIARAKDTKEAHEMARVSPAPRTDL